MSTDHHVDALRHWIGEARWFGGKGRDWSLAGVRRVGELPDAPDGLRVAIELAQVDYDDGTTDYYQLPLAYYAEPQDRLGHALVGEWDGAFVYDAVYDREAMLASLDRLEARLGTTLFEQTREGQVLTEAGERLLAAVEAMALAAAEVSEGNEGGGLSGTLRISVSEGFGTWFLASRLPEFAAAHPGLTLDLVASSGFLSPSKREADIAVVLSRPKAGPVIARKLSDYALRLYASPAYLAAAGMPEQPQDLARGYRLVGYIPDLLYAPELRYLDEIHPGNGA